MSVFFDNNITDVGRQLWAEMQAGGSFMPTRIVIGSGYMPAGKTSRTMTAVAEPVQDIELNKAQAQPDGDYIFGGVFTNRDVAQAFYYRELALYAKVKRADGTETAEILYSYGNAGDNAELIPAYSTGTVIEKQLDLLVYIGNDANVTIEITTGVYVDRTEFNEAIAGITPAGIGALPADLPVISDMSVKDIVKSGRYYCFNCTDVPEGESNYGYLDVFVHHDDSDYRYLRYKSSINMNSLSFECLCDNGTWTDWVQAYSVYNKPHPTEIGAVSTHSLVQEADLVAWATKQTLSGSFLVSPAITPNVPNEDWFMGFLDVSSEGKRMTITGLNTYKQYVNVTRENIFMGWVEQYNEMNPPTTAGGVVPATVE